MTIHLPSPALDGDGGAMWTRAFDFSPGRNDMRRLMLIALLASAAFLAFVQAAPTAEAGAAVPARSETVYLSLSGLT
jgi:hypothetical protein